MPRPSYHYGKPGDVGSHAEYGLDLTQLNSNTSDLHLVCGGSMLIRRSPASSSLEPMMAVA